MKPVQTLILAVVLIALILGAMLIIQARQNADVQVATLMGTATAQYNAVASEVHQTQTAEQ